MANNQTTEVVEQTTGVTEAPAPPKDVAKVEEKVTEISPPTGELPKADIPRPFGFRGEERITEETPEVAGLVEEGLTPEAAIGTVAMREPKAAITTAMAKEEIEKTQADLAAEEAKVQAAKVSTIPEAEGQAAPTTETKSYYQGQIDNIDTEYGEIVSSLNQMSASLDPYYQGIMDDIKQTFARRKQEMEVANVNRLRGLEIEGSRTGRQRYAPVIQSGILGAEERAGIQRLADLDAQEKRLLLEARQALEEGKLNLAREINNERKGLRSEKNSVVDKLYSIARDEEMDRINLETRAKAKMDELLGLGYTPADLDASQVARIEQDARLPEGSFKQMYTLNQKNMAATELMNDLKQQKEIVDLLGKIPENQFIEIGGELMSGWKEVKPDVYISNVVDNDGNYTLITYDKKKGKAKKHKMGNIGGKKQGWEVRTTDKGLVRINKNTGETVPITSPGNTFNPVTLPGFNNWMDTIGDISTRFGDSVAGSESFHPGWDIAATRGTDVTAYLPGGMKGTVTKVHYGAEDNAYGKHVEITDDEGRVWRYSHLQDIGVDQGQEVGALDYVGSVGNTGNCWTSQGGQYRKCSPEDKAMGYGAHLDLRVFEPETQVKPDKEGQREKGSLGAEEFSETRVTLDETRGDDGFVNTEMYNNLFKLYQTEFKKGGDLFIDKFPPTQYLNPDDPTADFFRTYEKSPTTSSIITFTREDFEDIAEEEDDDDNG